MKRYPAPPTSCAERPDPALERRIDGYVARIAAAAAKDPDGYLNTYTQLVEPEHRGAPNGGNDREQHDLYNAGCLVEAGVHYYRATGKTELLRVAARLANHMCDVMGPPPRQNIVPGHALGEAAMVELYPTVPRTAGTEEADATCRGRGAVPAARPVLGRQPRPPRGPARLRGLRPGRHGRSSSRRQSRATPSARRCMAAGLTRLASATGREEYRRAARRLWENMTGRRMYVTGGVGAIAGDEKFGGDYVLPNDGYLETCAAVGAGFFHQRDEPRAPATPAYADELERGAVQRRRSAACRSRGTVLLREPAGGGEEPRCGGRGTPAPVARRCSSS